MNSPFAIKSFADLLSLHAAEQVSNKSSDDDANRDHAAVNFVDSMVQAIVINRASGTSLALPVVRASKTRTRRPYNEPNKKRQKYGAGAMIWTNPVDGTSCRLTPYMSQWYNYYIKNPPVDDTRFLRKFCRRFRVPHAYFVELTTEIEGEEAFLAWREGSTNCYGVPATPILLLLLAVLRYLGRAWTLDDLSENTCTSQEIIRKFLHAFLDFASTTLYQRYVLSPSCADDARQHMAEYSDAGFPGAVGSTDATHIILERVPNKHRQAHLGFKSTHTARAYKITVNHRCHILATTTGYPARWNNKTLAIFDFFMQDLHEGKILDDIEFNLYEHNHSGGVVLQRYRGGWLLVDNGCLAQQLSPQSRQATVERRFAFQDGWSL